MTDHHPDAGKMVSLTFTQPHPGGRILLMLGQHQAGAVFPPCPTEGGRWLWRWWLGGPTGMKEGRAKTELAAKNAILSQAREWLRKAGLQE